MMVIFTKILKILQSSIITIMYVSDWMMITHSMKIVFLKFIINFISLLV